MNQKFCYLRREKRGFNGRMVWVSYLPNGTMPDDMKWHRVKQSAVAEAQRHGYVVLPQGMTPDAYLELARWARRNANRWRVLLVERWSDPAAPRWMKQLLANLGESGLAKLKM